MDMSDYKDEFIDEAEEHLEAVDAALLDLENDPTDLDILNIIFRAAHTLKSSSAAMEFNLIAELTHEMENVLDVLRTGKVVATHDTIDILFESTDMLKELVSDVANDIVSDVDLTDITNNLKTITQSLGESGSPKIDNDVGVEQEMDTEETIVEEETVEETVEERVVDEGVKEDTVIEETTVEKTGDDIDIEGESDIELAVGIEQSCPMIAIRALMVLKNIEDFGEIISTTPSRELIEDGEFDLQFSVVLHTEEKHEKITQQIRSISEVEKVEISLPVTINQPEPGPGTVPQAQAQIEKSEQPSTPQPGPGTKPKTKKKAKMKDDTQSVKSVRVHIERLDDLMNLVGELVINKIRLMQISEMHKLPDLKEVIDQLNILTTNLQDQVMQIRMVPMDQVFNRFPRMIRDLSKSMDKQIKLEIEGSDIELDRTVLDEIGKPLVHLLRNCIDHGIELPEEREKLGKDPTGTIKLTAMRDKQTVNLIVEDDGKGIDPDKLRVTAVEKGLLSEEAARSMNDEEAYDLIFTPGFSTAKEVTDVSGRGVGMDVVKTKIASLGGIIKTESTLDVGTKVTLKLPISMAIVQALMVDLNKKIYAIPLSNVVATINVREEEMKTVRGQKVTVVQDKVLPLLSLADLFGEPGNNGSNVDVVVVEKNEQHTGLIVDSLIDQHEIVIKSFDTTLEQVEGFSGATILGDGNVVLIMDIDNLLVMAGY